MEALLCPPGSQGLKLNKKTPDKPTKPTNSGEDKPFAIEPVNPEALDKYTLAVPPFVNLSGDPDQDYFSDGISEDIITELSCFGSLSVISPATSFKFREKSISIQEFGQELGLHFIVEGSVRRAGNRVRIAAHLTEVSTGEQLWGQRYDRDLEDVFAIQDEVARAIATAVPAQIDVTAYERVAKKSRQELTAYENVLRGERLQQRDWDSPEAILF